MKTETLSIEGMSCSHCIKAITEALSGIPRLTVLKVELGLAVVRYDEAMADRAMLIHLIEEEGFTVASELSLSSSTLGS